MIDWNTITVILEYVTLAVAVLLAGFLLVCAIASFQERHRAVLLADANEEGGEAGTLPSEDCDVVMAIRHPRLKLLTFVLRETREGQRWFAVFSPPKIDRPILFGPYVLMADMEHAMAPAIAEGIALLEARRDAGIDVSEELA
jgi:hypothetical protein